MLGIFVQWTLNILSYFKKLFTIVGSFTQLGIEESRIPVILIQNPGVRQGTSTNYGSGWDIILPQNWSKAFWVAFVYHGARAAALRDLESLAFEQKSPFFPNDFPDAIAGKQCELTVAEKLKNKYNKRPPAKRCNYVKLGIAFPFSYPWCSLIQDWNGEESSDKIYVLRDWKVLKQLRERVNTHHKKVMQQSSIDTEGDSLSQGLTDHKRSLAQVELSMLSRGVPNEFGIICVPTQEDLRLLQDDSTYSGPKEPVHKEGDSKNNKKNKGDNSVISKPKGVKNSCSRPVIGYVNRGGFALGSGNGSGQGFCAVSGIKQLLQNFTSKSSVIVLVRNPSSYQYRYATLKIM